MTYDPQHDAAFDDAEFPTHAEDLLDDDYEEISSDEVDRVIEVLDGLIQTVESENIRWHLEEAAGNIFSLVYDDEGSDLEDSAASEAA